MKLFGKLSELSDILFRRPSGEITIRAKDTPAAAPTFELPDAAAGTHDLVDADTTQTLTNKSIDGDDNTITDIDPVVSLKTDAGKPHYVNQYSAAGVPETALLANENIASGADIDASKIGTGVVDNAEFNKLNTAGTDADGELVKTNSSQTLSFKDIEDANSKFINDNDGTKELQFELGGSTTATTTTLASSSSVSRTLTLPDQTGTLATLADVNAIDDAFQIDYTPTVPTDWDVTPANAGDALDELSQRVNDDEDALGVHELDTSTHGVGVIVGETEAATLTNKTLTSPVLNGTLSGTAVKTMTAGEGLTGGGDISADRTFDMDIPGLTEDVSPDDAADYLVTYDASGTAHKKVLISNLPAGAATTASQLVTTDTSTANVSVSAGQTLYHPCLHIDTGDTYTISGTALVEDCGPGFIVDGTLSIPAGGVVIVRDAV